MAIDSNRPNLQDTTSSNTPQASAQCVPVGIMRISASSLEEANSMIRKLAERVYNLETLIKNQEYITQKIIQDLQLNQQTPSCNKLTSSSRMLHPTRRHGSGNKYHPYAQQSAHILPPLSPNTQLFLEKLKAFNIRSLSVEFNHILSIIRDDPNCFNLLKEIANRPVAVSAKYFLARCYEKGVATAKNPKLAFEWLQKAAEQGHAPAQNTLGKYYHSGFGTDKNPKLAFEWFQKSAEQGHAKAQCSLSWYYEKGICTDKNPKLAFEWFQKSAEQGHAKAQNALGWCYHYGFGTNQNRKLAFEWFQKAAEQGHAKAQDNLKRLMY